MRQDRKYFAEWFDRTLIEREISGGEVARAVEVNDSAISRWRNGRASPGLDSVMKLARFLDITPPIRVAVTAGLMSAEEAGVERLPLPEDTKTGIMVRKQIMDIKGLTTDEREMLLAAYLDMKA